MTDNQACENTDREVWRGPDEGNGDYYADSVHVTKDGGIGINVGGRVIVMPAFEWHALATGATRVRSLDVAQTEKVLAWQWNGGDILQGDPDWVAETTEPHSSALCLSVLTGGLTVHTSRGRQRAKPSDWIIKIGSEVSLFSDATWRALASQPPAAPVETLSDVLASIPADLNWLIGKGKTRPDEPPFGVQLLRGLKVIAETEGDDLCETIKAAMAEMPK